MTNQNTITPELAQQVAKKSAADAGVEATDTIAQGCALVRAGVFFDGTGNSRDHVPVGGDTWHTNVDLLGRIYEEDDAPEVRDILGQPREVLYFPRYMRGIGVKDDGGTTARGMGHGVGKEGVENRVAQAMDTLRQDVRNKSAGMQPCDIWFDVFGFSRGAAAARDFANGVRDGEFANSSAKLKVKFLGLFDTVSSLGAGGHTGNYEGVTLNTNGNVAEKIVHITAKDEIREFFPLTLARKGERIEMVGAHSDIGGGYMPGRLNSTFSFTEYNYPGIREFFESRWGIKLLSLEPGVSPDLSDDYIVSAPNHGPMSEIAISNYAEHGLQFVSLRLMYDRAFAAGVPFREDLEGTIDRIDVSMPDDLKSYYEALKQGTPSKEMEIAIRRKYTHLSFNNEVTASVIFASLPEKGGTRKVDTM